MVLHNMGYQGLLEPVESSTATAPHWEQSSWLRHGTFGAVLRKISDEPAPDGQAARISECCIVASSKLALLLPQVLRAAFRCQQGVSAEGPSHVAMLRVRYVNL